MPVSGKHAIEVAAFVAIFQQPFSTRAVEALSSLQESLREDFPSSQVTNTIELRIENGVQATPQVGSVSGIFLQRIGEQGKQSWTLRAEGNAIVVQCFAYETWGETSPKALGFLQSAINVVADEENPLGVASLQIVDRFVAPSKDGYDIGHVFSKRSGFLSKHVFDAGSLWHIYQGWFEETTVAPGRLLNVLNLSTNDTPSGLVTTIDHNAQLQSPGVPISDTVSIEWLRSVFDELHTKNKTVVGALLNAKQKKAVNL